jgi:hypothetical protein
VDPEELFESTEIQLDVEGEKTAQPERSDGNEFDFLTHERGIYGELRSAYALAAGLAVCVTCCRRSPEVGVNSQEKMCRVKGSSGAADNHARERKPGVRPGCGAEGTLSVRALVATNLRVGRRDASALFFDFDR